LLGVLPLPDCGKYGLVVSYGLPVAAADRPEVVGVDVDVTGASVDADDESYVVATLELVVENGGKLWRDRGWGTVVA